MKNPIKELPPLANLNYLSWSWHNSIGRQDRLRYAAQYVICIMEEEENSEPIRLAIAAIAEPEILTTLLSSDPRQADWIRLVGKEAEPAQAFFKMRVEALNSEWRSVFSQLIASGQLAEMSGGSWRRGDFFSAAGLDLNSAHAQRATFAMQVVKEFCRWVSAL